MQLLVSLHLENLTGLDLSSNELKKFPVELEKMKNLSAIHLHNNPFTDNYEQTPNKDIFDLKDYPLCVFRKK